jgi:hypothetical protein
VERHGNDAASTVKVDAVQAFTLTSGVPPGLQVCAVSLRFANGAAGGQLIGASAPEHFVTP